MELRHNQLRMILGITLVTLGVIFLIGQVFAPQIWGSIWPLFIIAVGALFFCGMLYWGKSYGFLAIPGSIITGTGLLLLLQSLSGLWYTWAYAWTLYVAFVGAGLMIFGVWSDIPNLRGVGEKMILGGLVGFIFLGAIFELTIFANLRSGVKGIIWAVLLIGLGVYVLMRTSAQSQRVTKVVDSTFTTSENPSAATSVDNGTGKVKDMQLETVENVYFKGVGNLEIALSDHPELRIEANDEFLKHVITEVNGNTLTIRLDNSCFSGMDIPFGHAENVYYYLSLHHLNTVTHAGAGKITISSIQAEALTLRHEGAGEFTGTGLNVVNLEVELKGVGKMALDGKATHQNASLNGTGSYQADRLESESTKIVLSGLGSAELWVTGELDAKLSGAGSIHYRGNPQVTQQISGLGGISRVD